MWILVFSTRVKTAISNSEILMYLLEALSSYILAKFMGVFLVICALFFYI
jgi:hypothetical protein